MMRTPLLVVAIMVALTDAQNGTKKRVIRCFWGKCGIFHGAWKKCMPNEQCDGSELRCERQCILEHTGCPPNHRPGSCHKDLLVWKCSTDYTCPQSQGNGRCHKTCLPRNAQSRYNEPKNFLSLLPIVGPFFQ
ncbi:uncharacterized protein LOC144119340 isoform X2 [Amblyomma americanum]